MDDGDDVLVVVLVSLVTAFDRDTIVVLVRFIGEESRLGKARMNKITGEVSKVQAEGLNRRFSTFARYSYTNNSRLVHKSKLASLHGQNT